MLNPSMIICVCVVVSNRRCHRHLGRHFELQQRASTVGGSETCVSVSLNIDGRSIGLKFYRLFWASSALKFRSFLLYPVHFLHTWRNPVFAFYFCLLVKYICFCVGFVFFVYFSYGNNWHIYCIWLFIVSFITFFSFIVIRCEMSLVKFSNEMWWKMCDNSGARTVLSTTKPIYCSVLHARKRQNGLLRFEHGVWSFACVRVRVHVSGNK